MVVHVLSSFFLQGAEIAFCQQKQPCDLFSCRGFVVDFPWLVGSMSPPARSDPQVYHSGIRSASCWRESRAACAFAAKVTLVGQITVGQLLAIRASTSTNNAHLVTAYVLNFQLDPSVVSARLDADPWFACGDLGNRSAWHVVRLHHRCRVVYAPEAACERIGSYMHFQFRQWKGGVVSPSVLMGRVLLEQAHVRCVGSTRDELLIAEIAHFAAHFQPQGLLSKRCCARIIGADRSRQ